MKIPFVAAAALAAHNLKPELGSEMLSKASNALQKYIDSGSWRETKLLLRFLGGLQPVFEGDGIFPLLEELFARAVDLQTTSSEDVSHHTLWSPRLRSNAIERSCSDWSSSRSSFSPSPT